MAFYKKCPDCGANLDPGEKCDCSNNNDSFCVETDQRNAIQRNPTQRNRKQKNSTIEKKTNSKPQSLAL